MISLQVAATPLTKASIKIDHVVSKTAPLSMNLLTLSLDTQDGINLIRQPAHTTTIPFIYSRTLCQVQFYLKYLTVRPN